jgi:hypothetical protein
MSLITSDMQAVQTYRLALHGMRDPKFPGYHACRVTALSRLARPARAEELIYLCVLCVFAVRKYGLHTTVAFYPMHGAGME